MKIRPGTWIQIIEEEKVFGFFLPRHESGAAEGCQIEEGCPRVSPNRGRQRWERQRPSPDDIVWAVQSRKAWHLKSLDVDRSNRACRGLASGKAMQSLSHGKHSQLFPGGVLTSHEHTHEREDSSRHLPDPEPLRPFYYSTCQEKTSCSTYLLSFPIAPPPEESKTVQQRREVWERKKRMTPPTCTLTL